MKYIRAQPMQFMLNSPISEYVIYYVDNALSISSKRRLLRAACKNDPSQTAAGDWEIDTYCKNLSSPGLYAMTCWSSFIFTFPDANELNLMRALKS